MTVDELEDFIKYYKQHHAGSDAVVVCDDGMQSRFFDIDFACGTDISRKTEDAKIEMKDNVPYQIEPPQYKTESVLLLRTDLYSNEIN